MIYVFLTLALTCVVLFFWIFRPRNPVSPDDALLFASVLSLDNQQVLAQVRLSIENPEEYFTKIGHLIQERSPVEPIHAAEHALNENQFAGAIDWRATDDELRRVLNPILTKHGIHAFDWSFVDRLIESNDEDSLKTRNLLPLVGKKTAELGLVLVGIFMGSDNYHFSLATPDDFDKIKSIRGDTFWIDRFS